MLQRLAKLLRVPADEAEAVLRHDDKRARETVSRRRFMGAAAAIASAPFVPGTWVPARERMLGLLKEMRGKKLRSAASLQLAMWQPTVTTWYQWYH
jgi:hypothetical protein